MKAIIMKQTGDCSVLQLEETEELIGLLPNQVKVKVEATAVNYIDTLIRSGEIPPGMMPELPFVPGVECIGVIVALGDDVTGMQIGDKVAYFGPIGASTYAEFVVTDCNDLVKISNSLKSTEAAIIPVNYSTAYHMLHNIGHITADSTIFVHAAAGGVGTAIIQLAKMIGATIIGSVGSDEKKKYILNQGADFAVNYKTENIFEIVHKITKAKGVDISLNPIAGSTMISDLDMLSPFGHLIIFGFITGLPEEKLQEAMLNHFGKSLTISFSDIYTLHKNNFKKLKKVMSILFNYLSEGKIDPMVHKELPLSKAKDAHQLLESGVVEGKVVIIP